MFQPIVCSLSIDAVAEVSEVVKAYNQSSANEVSGENLEFAKAVCCLRQLCVLKVCRIDW